MIELNQSDFSPLDSPGSFQHEIQTIYHQMPAALAAKGVEVLKDARTRVTINGESLELVGIRFWTRRGVDIAPLTRGATGTTILLAHDPRRITEASALNKIGRAHV